MVEIKGRLEKNIIRVKRKLLYKNNRKTLADAKDIHYRRISHLRRKYGMTLEEFQKRLESQNNVCMICHQNKVYRRRSLLCVDHDHITGRIRGLLCGKCNSGLAMFEDDVLRLEKAIEYLNTSRF